jgi:two-component system sensor histidine kinase YesM
MNLWQKGKRRMLRSVRIRSLKDTSLRLGTPVFLVLMGLVVCLLWGVWENRKLADKYIADTAKLYVDQINRDMSQINSELIYLLDSDSNIKEIPDQITSTDAQYYEMEQTLRERNRVLKIRYHEIQTFFVYGQKANVLITDSGTMFTESKGMTTLNQMLMSYLQIMTSKDSISTQWTVITFGDDDYIVGWYAKNKKVIGCVINLNLIFRTIRAKTEEYDVIPFMVDARGRVMTQADTSEKYKNEIIDFSKAGKKKEKNATVYSYQLGTVGKINLMVLPGGGILENVLIMQIAFVVLIAVLLLVCALEITAYYHRILEPLEKFGQKLEELEKEQSLNDDGSNNLLELESVSGKFKELLRKIQGLKIAIYEKELAEQKAELEHIEAYIRIQKLRYGEEAFSFEATMDGDIGEWKVPSLLLQTLVENSVVHGVSLDRKSEISLYLTNETYEDGEYLYICISDTGNGFSKEALDAIEHDTPIIYHGRHHVGISNIKRRLALMYGERASITCSNMDENYGAVVEVRLPKTE